MIKITPSVDINSWLKRLDTHLNEPTNLNTIKVLKLTTLGTGLMKKQLLNYDNYGLLFILVARGSW